MTPVQKLVRIGALLLVSAVAKAEAPPREVIATGTGEVKFAPDEVLLSLAVDSVDHDIMVARAKTDERVKKVLALTGSFKIDPKHVQTDRITIEPRYRDNDRSNVIAYAARRSIVVCLKDVARFEELLTAVLKAGTNNVEGIQFLSTEMRKHRDEARLQALRAAKEKATAMAKELGVRLGKPRLIEESGSGYAGRSAYSNSVSNAGDEAAVGAGLALGQISVTANVSVHFEMLD